MKKVSAIIVCCLLVMALIALPVLAAQTATFTATASSNTVTHGDTFTVTFSVSEIENLKVAGYQLVFDADRFEYVKYTKGTALKMSDYLMSGVDVGAKIAGYIMYNEKDEAGETISGELLVVTFRVKSTAPVGASTITCTPNAEDADNGAVTCNAVGATVTITCNHQWGQWAPDGANHKRVCTKCSTPETASHSFGAYTVTTPAGCDKAGVKTATCPVCNAPDEQAIQATGNHTYGAWTKADDTNHKRTCTTCQDGTPAVETKAHTWNNGAVTTPAGCDKAGVKTYTCTATGCGDTKEEPIQATGNHTFTGAWTKADDTNHKRTCTTCQDGTPAVETKAHTWGAWNETTHPDCKNPGEEKRECTANCGAFETRPVPSTGAHSYNTWTKVDDEKHTATCSGCGEFPVTKDHTWDAGTVTTPAGCDKAGVKTYTCTATGCGDTKEEPIQATGNHTYGAWTKADDTNHKRTCTTCQDGTPEVETKAHTWDNGAVTTPAGCDKAGVKTYTCTATGCGDTKEEPIQATGNHTYGAWTKVDDQKHQRTCTSCTDGTPEVETEAHNPSVDLHSDADNHWNVCYCGEKMNVTAHVYNDLVGEADGHTEGCECGVKKNGAAKAPHTWDAGVVTKKPSKTEYGEKTFTCADCEFKRTERIDKVTTPNTGDNTLVIPMVILAVLSACGLAVTVVARKRASR